MSFIGPKSAKDLLNVSMSETMDWDPLGRMFLEAHNRYPNQYFGAIDEDGEPTRWALSEDMPEKVIAHHINITPAVTGTNRPRKNQATRQTSAAVPVTESGWALSGPVISGIRTPADPGVTRKELPPVVEKQVTGMRGFEAGAYAYVIGLSDEFRRPTTTTARRSYALLAGQVPVIPIPDYVFSSGARYMDIYKTKKDSTTGPLFLQRKIPVAQLAGLTEYRLNGPWRPGPRPPARNMAGVGVTAKPTAKEFRISSKPPADRHNLKAGYYRPFRILANNRGPGLWSVFGDVVKIEGTVETYREKVLIDQAQGSALAASDGVDESTDPSKLRAPGKRPEADYYYGEEIDPRESRLVGLINERRREDGKPLLALNAKLNRAAYTGDAPEDYSGTLEYLYSDSEDVDDAFADMDSATLLAARFEAVGVAREGGRWTLILGDDAEIPDAGSEYCEFIRADGSVERLSMADTGVDAPLMVDLGFSLVSNNQLNYTYSGSFGSNVSTAAARVHALGVVSCRSVTSGAQVAISDGALEAGIAGRTYSDGRIVLSTNSNTFTSGTTNAKNAVCIHELFHGLGFDHVTTPSVLNTPIYYDRSSNHESPTTYDVGEYRRKYGDAPSGGSGGGSGGTTGYTPTGGTPPEEPAEPQYKWVTKTRTLPYKKNAGFVCTVPKAARVEGINYTWGVQYEPLQGGSTITYRAYPKRSRFGAARFFSGDRREVVTRTKHGRRKVTVEPALPLVIHGYTPEEEPAGLRIGLIQEDAPTEDLSLLPAPDPSAIPDEPQAAGQEQMASGPYFVMVQGVTESGKLTIESEPTLINITSTDSANGTTLQVRPVKTVNLLPNAEGGALGANGVPIGLTTAGNGAFPGPVDGVFSVDATGVTQADAPVWIFPAIPVTPESVLTVSGYIGATRWVQGAAALVLEQLDDTLASLGEISIGSHAGTGEIPVSKTIGPAGTPNATTALAAGTSWVKLRLRASVGTDAAANLTATFRDLKVLPYLTDVRKVEEGEGVADNFDPPPITPLEDNSFAAVGIPPSVGTAVVESEPPLDLQNFESGAWGADWTRVRSPASGATTAAIVTTAAGSPLPVGKSWRISDDTVGAGAVIDSQKTFTSMDSMAIRILLWAERLPTYGDLVVCSMVAEDLRDVIQILLTKGGNLVARCYTSSGSYSDMTIAVGIVDGTLIDVEAIAAGGGTTNGRLSVSVGLNGAKRGSPKTYNTSMVGRLINKVRVGGYNENDSRAKWTLSFDNIVVTKKGDILTRETPVLPASLTPPTPDRPSRVYTQWTANAARLTGDERVPVTSNGHYYTAITDGTTGGAQPVWPTTPGATVADNTVTWQESGSIYREFDPDGNPINQLYYFIRPDDGVVTKDLLNEPMAVKPGATYTEAWFARYAVFGEDAPGISVRLEGEGVEPLTVAALGVMTGVRDWHTVDGEDDAGTYTVPDGYMTAMPQITMTPGVYVLQEPLNSRIEATTFAARDTRRGFAREVEGEVSVILDSKPPMYDYGIQPGVFWQDFGVVPARVPAGCVLTPDFGSSSNKLISDYVGAREIVIPDRYLHLRARLTGDGRNGPEIAPGGMYLRTWHPFGYLLRADGTHFPGVAWCGNGVSTDQGPITEAKKVGGHVQIIGLTEAVEYIFGLKLQVQTETAKKEIYKLSAEGEPFILHIPTAEPARVSGAQGMAYTVRFAEQARFEEANVAPMVMLGERVMYFSAEISEAEVLEAAPLLPYHPVPVRTDYP